MNKLWAHFGILNGFSNYEITAEDALRGMWRCSKWNTFSDALKLIPFRFCAFVRECQITISNAMYLMLASKPNYSGITCRVHTHPPCVCSVRVCVCVRGVNLCHFDSWSQFIISNHMRTCVTAINKMKTPFAINNSRSENLVSMRCTYTALRPRLFLLAKIEMRRAANAFNYQLIEWNHFHFPFNQIN